MGIITDWISSLRSKRSADSASELLSYKALAEARRQFEELSGEPIDWTPRKTQLKFLDDLQESGDLAPINKLVNFLIEDAVVRGASDIHVEPCGKAFRVRYRVDGVLSEVMRPPPRLQNAVIDRVKLMAKLDIAEKRLPQEGGISVRFGERNLDLRVSTIPVFYGENVVIQILDSAKVQAEGHNQ